MGSRIERVVFVMNIERIEVKKRLMMLLKKKTFLWFLMHLLGLHISMKIILTSMMTINISIPHPKVLHSIKMVVKDKETRNIEDARKIKYCLLFLMTLPALLSSISLKTILLTPILKLQWRVSLIIPRDSLQHTFREDLHSKTTLVFYSLLPLETSCKITNGFKEREWSGNGIRCMVKFYISACSCCDRSCGSKKKWKKGCQKRIRSQSGSCYFYFSFHFFSQFPCTGQCNDKKT